MIETRVVKVLLRDGTIKECIITPSKAAPWNLAFSGVELEKLEFSGNDLFEALVALRAELEKIGAQLLCMGARIDVFPSGMSRDMSGGRKAYVTRMGAAGQMTDLVDILDFAAPELVGSVAQQSAFHEKWIESFGERKP
jgi:hypothetical protein